MMLLMDALKRALVISIVILVSVPLGACGIATPLPINMATATTEPVFTPVIQIPTSLPTDTLLVPLSTPTPLPFMALEGLRVAYVINGNLYVQDSGKEPAQLTNSGFDRSPMFSDDGERLIFYRGDDFDPYSINADGSQEQLLEPPDLLTKLDLGYSAPTQMGNLAFVPGTHQLLFNTTEVRPWNDNAPHMSPVDAHPNQDVFLMDIDTKEVKRLLAPGKGGIFQLSPDGKLDIAYTNNYIDVIGIYGQLSRRHMITLQPGWDYEWTGSYWTRDSSKFIFVAPINGNADGTDGPEPDAIWQYSIESNTTVEIRLNPPPMQDSFAISPDGNWIVYNYFYYPGKTDETIPTGVYIGNLRNGSSHLVESGSSYGLPHAYEWSPNSEHFIFENDRHTEMYLGNTQGEVTPLNIRGYKIVWLDDQRYIYFPYKEDTLEIVMGEIGKEGKVTIATGHFSKPFTFVFLGH